MQSWRSKAKLNLKNWEKVAPAIINVWDCDAGWVCRGGFENHNSDGLSKRHRQWREKTRSFFCNIEPGFMSLGVCWLRKGKKRKFPAHHLRPRQFWPFSWAGHLEALPKSPLPSRPLAITSTPSTFHQSFTNFMKYFLSSRHFGC